MTNSTSKELDCERDSSQGWLRLNARGFSAESYKRQIGIHLLTDGECKAGKFQFLVGRDLKDHDPPIFQALSTR